MRQKSGRGSWPAVVPGIIFLVTIVGCGNVKTDRDGDDDADSDAGDMGGDDSTSGDTPVDHVDDEGGGGDRAFMRTYGGNENDSAFAMVESGDGGFVVAGDTYSYDEGGGDVWVVRIDAVGTVVWERTYGGAQLDEGRAIVAAPGGGYVVAGRTESFGAGSDGAMWILKLGSDGAVDWERIVEGGGAASVAVAGGGGYFVAGSTTVHGAGASDAWVVRLAEDGSVTWQNSYGGTQNDVAYAVAPTSDDGCVVAGWTSVGVRYAELWVMKLSDDGSVDWSRSYGGDGEAGEDARAIEQTPDGGYIVVGSTMSFGAGNDDIWILKLDSSGAVEWESTYGGTSADRGFAVHRTTDGGFLVAGRSESFGAGGGDLWVLKLGSTGSSEWQRTYGSSYDEQARVALETADGWYVIAGKDAYYGASGEDFWVIKMDTDGEVSPTCSELWPDMIDSPSASPASSSATVEDRSMSPAATSAATSETSATTSDSTAAVNEQCRSS